MSNWTHIIGSFYIETYTKRKNIKKYVEKILQDAPKITGSEEDTAIFVNALPGHNVSSWERNKQDTDWETYQTCVCITLVGDLRDSYMIQTEEELDKFVDFIEQKFSIYYSSVAIYEDYSGEIKQYRKDLYNEN